MDASVPGRGTVLVVDDDATNQRFLRAQLARQGYEVVEAHDGAQALQVFADRRPDIVFMDVMMPRLNGYEAARRIKAQAGEHFVPVIFLTALTDDASLVQCIEAGGDDFLTKPYRLDVLMAKVAAMERIRKLSQRLHRQNEELRMLQDQRARDDELAQRVFDTALAGSHAVPRNVRHLTRPAVTFNGDLLLTAPRPGGGFNLLLGDFTGHGLAAAIGALPVSEVFRAMTAKGFAAAEILAQLNHKLHALLPPDMFLSACLVCLDREVSHAEVWNGGMPDVLVVDGASGRIRERLPSRHLPLGITAGSDGVGELERAAVTEGDRLVLVSDGLIEARNRAGEEFGEARLAAAVEGGAGEELFARVLRAIEAHGAPAAPDDDISLVEIRCQPEAIGTLVAVPTRSAAKPFAAGAGTAAGWRWSLELRAAGLKAMDPVPIAISQLQELPGVRDRQATLYTVLSELYSNALYHGVLRLDSKLKDSADGFERYYQLRDERLAVLTDGFVRLELELYTLPEGARLRLCIEDSGDGFDPAPYLAPAPAEELALAGRGIALVRSLCESLRYQGRGNRVEAIYAW